jgi:hypothetical protein
MGTPASFNTQSYIIPLSGAAGPAVGIPELPSPAQLAPSVMAAANAAPTCPPLWPPCATGPMLHTHPIALADPMAAIPTPQQLAPHVFMNGGNPTASPAPQPPVSQPPPQPKQPQAPPAPPAPAPAPPKPKAPIDEFDGVLSDELVKTLNRQLNDPDEITRATAATDLSKILQDHPKLADSPDYKPTIDAFMEKIMKDPSTLVRGMGEMTFQLGAVKNPSEPVRNQLKGLAKKDDKNLTKESEQASSILAGLESGTLGKDLQNLTGKKSAKPGAKPDAKAGSPANPAAQTPPVAPSPEVNPTETAGIPGAPPGAAQSLASADPGAASVPASANAYYPPAMPAYPQGPAAAGANQPAFGSRLNVVSSPQVTGAIAGTAPQAGQRFNVYEGPKS